MLHILYEALRTEYGTSITTEDSNKLRQKLYAERRKANDPDLAQLSLKLSPFNPQTELWLVKNAPVKPEEGAV